MIHSPGRRTRRAVNRPYRQLTSQAMVLDAFGGPEVGEGVTGLSVGDRVLTASNTGRGERGTHAET
ncbi:hypothetical protein [Mycobacterium aquaticum]|nr:hypothetical protein [Mycobacterium aquaticum]